MVNAPQLVAWSAPDPLLAEIGGGMVRPGRRTG
jgi:hypothetical protein